MNVLKLEKKERKQSRIFRMQINIYANEKENEEILDRFRKMCDALGYSLKDAALLAIKAMVKANGY